MMTVAKASPEALEVTFVGTVLALGFLEAKIEAATKDCFEP